MRSNEVDVTPININAIDTILPKKVLTKIFP